MREEAVLTLPPSYEDGAAPSTMSGLQVREPIPYHVGVGQAETEITGSTSQHRNPGLAALATLAEALDDRFGVVKAVVDAVNVSSSAVESRLHLPVEFVQEPLMEMPFGDSRLIGYHHHRNPQLIEQANGLGNARQNLKLIESEGRVHDTSITVIDERVDHTVAI